MDVKPDSISCIVFSSLRSRSWEKQYYDKYTYEGVQKAINNSVI